MNLERQGILLRCGVTFVAWERRRQGCPSRLRANRHYRVGRGVLRERGVGLTRREGEDVGGAFFVAVRLVHVGDGWVADQADGDLGAI